MQTLPTSPGRLIKSLAEFIDPTFPAQNGDDFSREALTQWGDALDQAERDLPPFTERLDALNDAIEEGWCPSRIVQSELDHLNGVLCAYHLRKYRDVVVATLNDATADFATWQTLTPAQRDEIIAADERAEAERLARREAENKLRQRTNEFYAAMQKANISPPRWLDNDIANWSLA